MEIGHKQSKELHGLVCTLAPVIQQKNDTVSWIVLIQGSPIYTDIFKYVLQLHPIQSCFFSLIAAEYSSVFLIFLCWLQSAHIMPAVCLCPGLYGAAL